MHKSLILALCLSVLFANTYAITVGGVAEIIAGLFDGIIEKDDLNEIKSCIAGGEDLAVNIEDAVGDFKEGGLAGYSEGLMEIQQFITKLPASVGKCEAIQDDLHKMGQWAVIFLEPTTFISTVSYNLVWHYSEIHGDIDEAIVDYDTQKYFDFGLKIGEALVIATQH